MARHLAFGWGWRNRGLAAFRDVLVGDFAFVSRGAIRRANSSATTRSAAPNCSTPGLPVQTGWHGASGRQHLPKP